MLYSKIDTRRPRPQRFSPPLQNSCMLRPPSLPSLPFPADCAMHKPFIAPTRATFCRAESKRRRRYIRQDSGGGKATLVGFAISRWRTDGGKGGRLGWRSPLAFMAKGREGGGNRIKGEGFSEQEEEKEYKPPLKVPPAFTRSNPAAAVVVAFVRDLVGGRANFSSAIFGTA